MRFRLLHLLLPLALLAALAGCGQAPPAAAPTPPPPTAAAAAPEATAAPEVPTAPTPEPTDGTIRVGATGPARPISPRILGTNVPAWLDESLADQTFTARAKASDARVVRMPGGSWGNTYNWLACQVEKAPPCDNAARPSDFIAFMRATGTEGMWVVSMNGTAKEAAALVAFFNGTTDDERPIGVDVRGRDWETVGHWARLRAEAGYPDPVGMQLFEIGNELYAGKPGSGKDCLDYGWEDGWTCDGVEYIRGIGEGAERREGFIEFRNAMREVDPSILVGAVGIPRQSDWGDWGNEVIAAGGQDMDFYIVHQYAYFQTPGSKAEILAEPQQTWKTIFADVRAAFDRHAGGRDIPIVVNEFNLFSFQDNDTGRLMTRAVNMLHLADTFGQLAEYGVAMANQYNLANGVTETIGNYGMLDAGSYERYPQYYVLPLWSRFGAELLPSASSFDAGRELSVYAGRTKDGEVSLLVINKAERSLTATVSVEGVSAVTGGRADIAQAASLDALSVSFNGVDNPADDLSDAPPIALTGVSPRFNYTFTPFSVTLLRLDVER
jgi:alpha-L-arabinofuranosidase